MQHALKLNVDVGEDHLVRLPDEVPVGPAEIIVIVGTQAPEEILEDFEPIQPRHGALLSDLVGEDRE